MQITHNNFDSPTIVGFFVCGIRGDLHFHNLRDTYAVIRYLETNDIYLVSKELGHKNIKMTLKYANFSIRKLKRDFPSIDVFVKPSHRKYLIRETDIRETCEVQMMDSRVFIDKGEVAELG